MQPIRLYMWQEQISLEDAFVRLRDTGLEMPVLKELGKRLLYLRSFEEFNIEDPPASDLDEMRQSYFHRLRLTTPELIERWFVQNRQTPERFQRQLLHQNQLNRLRAVVVTDDMVSEAFLKRKPKLDTITFSLMRVNSEALAKELYHRICDDHQDFAELARQFSNGAEAPAGGLVGPRPIGELNPELRRYLLALKPGEVSEPFTLDDKSYMLVRILRVENAQLNPALDSSIRDELFDQWTERQLGLAELSLYSDEEQNSLNEKQEARHK